MNAKQALSLHRFRIYLLIPATAALLSAWAGPSQALFSPSVEVTLSGASLYSHVSQLTGPALASTADTGRSAGAWTNYGTNAAGVSIWADRDSGGGNTGYWSWMNANSKWTDALTVFTPSAAAGSPVDLLFSIRLHGRLEVNATPYAQAWGQANFQMRLNEHGEWISRPDLVRKVYAGWTGPLSSAIDVDEIQYGHFRVPNGVAFNLIAELGTYVKGDWLGPYNQHLDAESAFDHTVQWLGGSVWIGDAPVSDYTITSASGFDYRIPTPPTSVPEPGILALLGIGLACLGALRRFS